MAVETQLEIEEPGSLPTLEHGIIATNLISAINSYVKPRKLGRVVDASAEFKFAGKNPNRFPDVSFVSQSRLPANLRTYADFAPDLAIEIASPTDKAYQIQAKVKQFQKSAVKLIWVIYPFTQTVDIYRLPTGLVPHSVGITETLDGEDVIPGFKLPISEIFDYPIPPDDFDDTNFGTPPNGEDLQQ